MADNTTEKPTEAARQEAAGLGAELRDKGAEAAHAAQDTARHYAARARDEAYARGEEYRDYAADEAGKVASALRRASQDLSAGSPQERLVGQLADGVADAADRMRGMTAADIARDTTEFARRHPAAFLGGAALIGFAAARFLKATAHEEPLYLPASESRPAPAGGPGATGVTTATTGAAAAPGASSSGTATPQHPSPGAGSGASTGAAAAPGASSSGTAMPQHPSPGAGSGTYTGSTPD